MPRCIAIHLPGRAVKLQWSRADEHRLEPASPAMVMDLSAGLDEHARLLSWDHECSATPTTAGRSRWGQSVPACWRPGRLPSPARARIRGPAEASTRARHRNADPLYDVGDRRIVGHFVGGCPIRTSSTRSLGAFGNVFAIESFMDELARAAGAPPDEFRIAHLRDRRAVEVIEAAVDLAGGLIAPGGIDAPGRGLAFARYENVKAYVAITVEANVDACTGRIIISRAWIAADAGEVIDPGGLTNQLEGGFGRPRI